MKQAVFDIECDNIEPKKVKNVWCIVIQDVDTEEIFKYGPHNLSEGVNHLQSFDRIIGHNIITYDLVVLDYLYGYKPKLYIDTLVLSRLANPDRKMPWGMGGPLRPHSIDAWSVRLGGPRKVVHEDWSQYSEEMMNRCVTDVKINMEVYKALWNEFRE